MLLSAPYLVSVVPPRHDGGVLVSVLPEPVVRLPEVVQDVAAAEKGWKLGKLPMEPKVTWNDHVSKVGQN